MHSGSTLHKFSPCILTGSPLPVLETAGDKNWGKLMSQSLCFSALQPPRPKMTVTRNQTMQEAVKCVLCPAAGRQGGERTDTAP